METNIVACEDAVQKLQSANDCQEEQEHINQLCSLGRVLHVILVYVEKDLVPVGAATFGSRLGRVRGPRCSDGLLNDRCGRVRRDRACVLFGSHRETGFGGEVVVENDQWEVSS